jgi:hypothetical protein
LHPLIFGINRLKTFILDMLISDISKLPDATHRSRWAELLDLDETTLYRAERNGELKRVSNKHQAVYTKKAILRWLGLEKA